MSLCNSELCNYAVPSHCMFSLSLFIRFPLVLSTYFLSQAILYNVAPDAINSRYINIYLIKKNLRPD